MSINGPISENVSLLDSGLTTLAAISTVIVTLVRRRLDAEIGLRQCQNESLVTYTVRSEGGLVHLVLFGEEHSFEMIDSFALVWKPYWRSAMDLCQYASANHGAVLCLMLLTRYRELPKADPTDQCRCQEDCNCIASRYVDELEPILALTYRVSVRVDRDWFVYQCRSCITNKCHCYASTRELCIPDPVPLDLREITRYEDDSLGQALESPYISELFTVSNQMLLLPVRRNNNAKVMRMFGLSLEGMDVVSRSRMHSVTSALRSSDYRIFDELTAAWEGSAYYTFGIHATEALLNLFLVFIFRIDPMSSALAARRAVRGFTVDSTGSSVTLAEYLEAARVVKSDGIIEGVMQIRLKAETKDRIFKIIRLVPAAGNVVGLMTWSIMILLNKHPVKWTGGYEELLQNWALFVLLFPLLLTFGTILAAWQYVGYFVMPFAAHAGLLLVLALVTLAEMILALVFHRYHIFRRAVQVSFAWLSFFQWQLGVHLLGAGSPDQSPPSTCSTLVYAQTFVLTGFLAATGGKWQ